MVVARQASGETRTESPGPTPAMRSAISTERENSAVSGQIRSAEKFAQLPFELRQVAVSGDLARTEHAIDGCAADSGTCGLYRGMMALSSPATPDTIDNVFALLVRYPPAARNVQHPAVEAIQTRQMRPGCGKTRNAHRCGDEPASIPLRPR